MAGGVSWIGIHVDDVEQAASFFEDVLGLTRRVTREDFVVLDAPNGDRVELFGPTGPQPEHQFERSAVMAGFAVDDLDAARERLTSRGVQLLGERDKTWQHFRGPGGLVFEINQAKPSS